MLAYQFVNSRWIFLACWILSLPGCRTGNTEAEQTEPQPITVRLAKPSRVTVPA